MLEPTTVRHELHALIDSLDDEAAAALLDELSNRFDDSPLTPEEEDAVREGLAEIRRGEYITGAEFRRKYVVA